MIEYRRAGERRGGERRGEEVRDKGIGKRGRKKGRVYLFNPMGPKLLLMPLVFPAKALSCPPPL